MDADQGAAGAIGRVEAKGKQGSGDNCLCEAKHIHGGGGGWGRLQQRSGRSKQYLFSLTAFQLKWFWQERARSQKKLARTVRGQTQPTIRTAYSTVRV